MRRRRRDRGRLVQGRQGVHTNYIEEPVACSVKHGKRGEIPRGPTTSHSRTGLRQRPPELLPEGLRRASIAVCRSAFDPEQFGNRGTPRIPAEHEREAMAWLTPAADLGSLPT